MFAIKLNLNGKIRAGRVIGYTADGAAIFKLGRFGIVKHVAHLPASVYVAFGA